MKYIDYTLVIDKNNKPCNPITEGQTGFLLRKNKAKIVNHDPLVIQRIDDYLSENETRSHIELKIDSGYLNVGFSVGDNQHEYLSGQVELLKNMSSRILDRNSYRRQRRSRIRYRKNINVDYKTVHNPTYQNGNQDGWFAPSIQHKINSHIRLVNKIASWIPINEVIIEVAKFDIQQIKAMSNGITLEGKDYQNGEMKGYENAAAYVRDRDKHTCQLCGTKSDDKKHIVIEVHHVIRRSDGGSNKPSNLISLCHSCHKKVHSNEKLLKELQSRKISDTYKDSTYMNMVRWKLYEELSNNYIVTLSYGYITKMNRRKANLPKFHYNDALCIKNFNDDISLTKNIYIVEQKRCNDRCMVRFNDAKYIDKRDGKVKGGSKLSKQRTAYAPSKRVTQKEYINNLRIYRGQKTKKGSYTFVNHAYCLKAGDLIYVNHGKYKGIIAEVMSMKISPSGSYRVIFKYEGQTAKEPSVSIKPGEYELLKKNELEKIKIVRTRRGMIWRKVNRLQYEEENTDQYSKSS